MRCALLSLVLSLFTATSFAQTTGLPPFGSFDAGPFDTVNRQNLNANFAIPILSTPGRVTGFNLSVVYDSLIWQNNGTAWTPVTDKAGNPIWGWKTIFPLGDTLYKHTVTSYSKRCSIDYYDYVTTETYNGYVYRGPDGTTHSFPAVFWKEVTDNCTGSVTDTSQLTGNAGDASGFYIDITDQTSPTVKTASGLSLSTNVEDTNGNITTQVVVSSTETDWKDTAGLTAVRVIQNGSNTEYHYYDSGGTDQLFTLKRKLYSIKTAFACSGITDYNVSGTMPQVNLPFELDLPNGQKYTFTYEPTPNSTGFTTGRLNQVTLPTVGTIQYSYPATSNNGINCSDGTVVNLSRTFSDGTNTATWNYVRNLSALTTTVTTPQLADTPNANDTVYTFSSGGAEISRKIYANSPGTGTPLRTVNTTWAANGTPATQVTILEDGTTQSEVDTTFDSNGLLDSVSEYDWGSGTRGNLVRTTTLTYQTATAYTSRNMINLVTQKIVKDANNVTQFRRDISYDETSYINALCVTGAVQHDDTGYGCSFATRGLPTSITGYANAAAGSGALTQHAGYDSLGNVVSVTDPATNTTSVSYTDNYSDGVNHSTYARPTTITQPVTNGVSHTQSLSYYYYFGLPYRVTDQNGQITTFSYDLMRRASSVTDPANAVVNFTYGATSAESVLNFNSGNSTSDGLSTVDGLGRVQVQQARQAPNATSFDSVEKDYDLSGRVRRVTMPYSGSAGQTNSTAPATITAYDVLGRPSTVTDGGGGTLNYTYTKNDALVAVGPAPTGENTKQRQMEYDGLGRLTSVCEITMATGNGTCGQTNTKTGYWTKYTYDAAGRLLTVTQNAQTTPTQTRTYGYDSLGRLTSETNPESGLTTYVYDSLTSDPSCGTVSFKGDLVKRTDAVGNVTCYAYDALHRATSITYPTGSYASNTSNKYFAFDAATVNSQTMQNAKGRLAEAYTAATQSGTKLTDLGFSYTARGEVSDVYQSTSHSGGYYHVTASYWAHGMLNQLSNLTGIPTITYGVDAEGRPSTVSANSGQNPVTGTAYNLYPTPPTQPNVQVTLGSSDSDTFTYDANTGRMTQYKFTVGATPQSVIGNLTWNANGSLGTLAITDPFNAADTRTCIYLYDDLSRIGLPPGSTGKSVDCGATKWQDNYGYDAFGNITKTVPTGGTGDSFQPTYSPTTNRMTALPGFTPTYDNNGNVTNDQAHTYSWDSEGRPVNADGVGLTYDVLGRMVEQNRSGSYTQIVYAPGGGKLALMIGQTLSKAFVPLPGGGAAVYNSAGLQYYRHADWLGSSRFASTPTTRAMYSDTAYAPFGETYAPSGTADPSFTGQNQDTAANLYDFMFREYTTQGRWPSPDPAGLAAVDPTNPQSWNRYAYVLNDPLDLVDPLGLQGPEPGPPPPSECLVDGIAFFGAACDLISNRFCSLFGQAVFNRAWCSANCPLGDCLKQPRREQPRPQPHPQPKPQPPTVRKPTKKPCTPLANNLQGTPAAGVDTLFDGFTRLTHPVDMLAVNATMFLAAGGQVVGGGMAIAAGCIEPTPFQALSCLAGGTAGTAVVAAGMGTAAFGVYFFVNETLPAFKDWGCHE